MPNVLGKETENDCITAIPAINSHPKIIDFNTEPLLNQNNLIYIFVS